MIIEREEVILLSCNAPEFPGRCMELLVEYGRAYHIEDSIRAYMTMQEAGPYWHLFLSPEDAVVDFNEWFHTSWEYQQGEDGKVID